MMANNCDEKVTSRHFKLLTLSYLILGILLSTSAPIGNSANAENSKFAFDSKQSSLVWTGKKVTGSHTGHVSIKSAEPEIKDGKLVGGTFTIDMSSISNDDLKDESYNTKLKNHLKSEDFFNVSKFPLAELKLTKVEPIADAKPGEPNFSLTGNLTMIGVTNPITFPALVRIANKSAFASATISVDRTKWNLRYGSGKFFEGLGDKLIYDEFTIDVKIMGAME